MKKYRVRKGSIIDKTMRAVEALDREPWSLIAFGVLCAGIMVACAAAYNGVVPAYQ